MKDEWGRINSVSRLCVQISTADETSFCGRITKQWSGLAKEAFTDADNYGISFPIDLDINVKAVLMGAVFLIVSIPLPVSTRASKDIVIKVLV